MSKPRIPWTLARLFERICPEPNTGCWLWQGGCISSGYGATTIGRRQVLVHRLAFELKHDREPGEAEVCHTCDTPACCNPDHLFLGSHQQNMADSKAKGRHRFTNNGRRGVEHHAAKLDPDKVREARKLHSFGWSYAALARRYGVFETPIKRAVLGLTWKEA